MSSCRTVPPLSVHLSVACAATSRGRRLRTSSVNWVRYVAHTVSTMERAELSFGCGMLTCCFRAYPCRRLLTALGAAVDDYQYTATMHDELSEFLRAIWGRRDVFLLCAHLGSLPASHVSQTSTNIAEGTFGVAKRDSLLNSHAPLAATALAVSNMEARRGVEVEDSVRRTRGRTHIFALSDPILKLFSTMLVAHAYTLHRDERVQSFFYDLFRRAGCGVRRLLAPRREGTAPAATAPWHEPSPVHELTEISPGFWTCSYVPLLSSIMCPPSSVIMSFPHFSSCHTHLTSRLHLASLHAASLHHASPLISLLFSRYARQVLGVCYPLYSVPAPSAPRGQRRDRTHA